MKGKKCELQRPSAEPAIPELDSQFPTSSAKSAILPTNMEMMVADVTPISNTTPKQTPVIAQDLIPTSPILQSAKLFL